jgi:hypothetical protein
MDASAARNPRRWWILIVLCLSTLVLVIDNFVLAVAVPPLAADLNASAQDIQWILVVPPWPPATPRTSTAPESNWSIPGARRDSRKRPRSVRQNSPATPKTVRPEWVPFLIELRTLGASVMGA